MPHAWTRASYRLLGTVGYPAARRGTRPASRIRRAGDRLLGHFAEDRQLARRGARYVFAHQALFARQSPVAISPFHWRTRKSSSVSMPWVSSPTGAQPMP
jgi:hypothetical protein